MSTAKMVADSTVPSDLLGDGRKRRKLSESRRNKKQKKGTSKELSKSLTSEDSDSDLDLNKDIQAIGGYVKDRHEMMEQMFKAVRGASLKRALPDILRDLPLNELKQRCLEQLEIMSRKRILRILDGDIPAEISSSGTEDSSEDMRGEEEAEGEEAESAASSEKDQGVEDIEEEIEEVNASEEGSEVEVEEASGEEEEEEEVDAEAESEGGEQASEDVESGEEVEESGEEVEEEEYEEVVSEDGEEQIEEEDGEEAGSGSENNHEEAASDVSEQDVGSAEEARDGENSEVENPVQIPEETSQQEKEVRAPSLTKEQMEILELEMRARAIKAMLNKHPKTLIPLLPSSDTSTETKVCTPAKEGGTEQTVHKPMTKDAVSNSEQHKGKVVMAKVRDSSADANSSKPTNSPKIEEKSLISKDNSSQSAPKEAGDPTLADSMSAETETEDGEVRSEGEINDDTSEPTNSCEKDATEHCVDSSTDT